MDISSQPTKPPTDRSSMLNNSSNTMTNHRNSVARRRSSVVAREHIEQIRHSMKIRSDNNLTTLTE